MNRSLATGVIVAVLGLSAFCLWRAIALSDRSLWVALGATAPLAGVALLVVRPKLVRITDRSTRVLVVCVLAGVGWGLCMFAANWLQYRWNTAEEFAVQASATAVGSLVFGAGMCAYFMFINYVLRKKQDRG